MRIQILSLLLGMGLAGFALAEGDVQAGQTKAAACGACHGADGNSLVPAFPKLAGQNINYLVKQMKDIMSGARSVPAMAGQLDGKSDQDLMDIAAYFAGQKGSVGETKKELVTLGEMLYRAGNKDIGVAACTACHSPTGSGNSAAGYPALSGQHADYVAMQLKAFRDGQRTNDGDAKIMSGVTYRLNNAEIEALASYIQGLH
ncbi:MAG: cytochrome c4 [Pseudomonadales bacterium]|nr:cytochrome c4 [Pseudomonadales bacterium]